MKKLIEWVKSSNHYYHIGLLAALALIILSIGSFEFGADNLLTNVWQTVKFGLLTGVVIEIYQCITTKSFNPRNTLGDLIADVIGLVLGVGFYCLLAWLAPYSAIAMYLLAVVAFIFAFSAESAMRNYLVVAFFCCGIVGISLFLYA